MTIEDLYPNVFCTSQLKKKKRKKKGGSIPAKAAHFKINQKRAASTYILRTVLDRKNNVISRTSERSAYVYVHVNFSVRSQPNGFGGADEEPLVSCDITHAATCGADLMMPSFQTGCVTTRMAWNFKEVHASQRRTCHPSYFPSPLKPLCTTKIHNSITFLGTFQSLRGPLREKACSHRGLTPILKIIHSSFLRRGCWLGFLRSYHRSATLRDSS